MLELIIEDDELMDMYFPVGHSCQWQIDNPDNDTYVILEFQNFNVRIIMALKRLQCDLV